MKYLLLAILLISFIALAGCSQTVVKYQCADGSFEASADLCSSKTCPEANCPELDCSMCPVKIETKVETKTITKYQCWDSSMKDNLNSCPKTEAQQAQEDCPDLKLSKPKQNPFDRDLYSVEWEENKLYDGWKIQCGLTCTSNCRKGKEEGENIDYYYCGKNFLDSLTLKKTITDTNGNILEVITKSGSITYNENFQYITTICN